MKVLLTLKKSFTGGLQKEVDFVVIHQDKFLPVEVKFQSIITRSNYSTMKRAFGQGILVTKDSFFCDNRIVEIPASIFLLLLVDLHKRKKS